MSQRIAFAMALLLMLALVISCSSSSQDIVTPPEVRDSVSESAGGTYMMGLWQFTADRNTGDVDIVQLRQADAIINVLGFMEPPALTLMDLDWPNMVIDFDNNKIDVGVILTHPIAGDDVFMGFDCRGVCFGPTVANADGATIIPSPEFFSGVPFGYQDGLVGAPDDPWNYEGIAGYKYFCDNLGADEDLATFFGVQANLDNRGKFGSGATNQRNYNLEWRDVGNVPFLVFNYAIYANYDWPVGDPPIGLDNFSITTANSAEAFCGDITATNSLYWVDAGTNGGDIQIDIEVWDWQMNIVGASLEAPDAGIPPTALVDAGAGSTPNSWLFSSPSVTGSPTSTADVEVIVTVTDSATFGESWFMDLLPPGNAMYSTPIYNCFVYQAAVSDCPPCTLTDINPAKAKIGDTEACVITGADILDGGSLGVTLKKAGESDIVATNVAWVSATEVNCDITIPDDELLEGLWDVWLYNGCGTPANVLTDGFEVTVLFSENFDTDPGSDWYCGTYQYWSGCAQGAPDYRTNSPYGNAQGALACPAVGSTLAGGAVATMVSPPFEIPAGASEVNIRVRAMWDLGGSWTYYTATNFKIGNGASPGLAPFSITGTAGTVMTVTTAHGGTNPGTVYYGGSGPMVYTNHWRGNFNNWPNNISNYIDLVVPAAYYGDPDVKFAFQCQPDWCGYPGSNTGIVLDDVEVIVY